MSSEAVTAVKAAGEVAAASVTVLALLKFLPAIAAAFAIIWYTVMIPVWSYEKITGKPFSDSAFAKRLLRKP